MLDSKGRDSVGEGMVGMVNLVLGFVLVVLGIMALAVGAFPVTIFLGVSGIIMMIRGALSITGTVLGGGFKLASRAITTKTCPYCKTRIPTGASVCPQCRTNLDSTPSPPNAPRETIQRTESDEWSI